MERIVEEGEDTGARQEEYYCCQDITYYFGLFYFGLILSLRKLRGFLLYGFPEEKHRVHCLLCLIVVLVIISVEDPNIMLA